MPLLYQYYFVLGFLNSDGLFVQRTGRKICGKKIGEIIRGEKGGMLLVPIRGCPF